MPPTPPAPQAARRPPPPQPAPAPAPQPAPAPAPQPDADASAAVHLGDGGVFGFGRATGPRVVPAEPEAGFRNLRPSYPLEAQIRGEQGAVGLLIHVSPVGTASAVDVIASSGYPVLDRAARNAVLRWRFNPEEKDGIPVASSLPFNMIFELEGR